MKTIEAIQALEAEILNAMKQFELETDLKCKEINIVRKGVSDEPSRGIRDVWLVLTA